MQRISFLCCFTIVIACGIARGQDIFEANKGLGRGINLGNALEVPRGADWGFVLKMEHFKVIADAGFQHVRMPVKWSDYAGKAEPFTIEEAWFTRIEKALDEAEKQKLRVVLNVHHYDEVIAMPREHLPRLKAIWKQVSARFAKRPGSVYFELLNEPNAALTGEIWNEMYPQLLAIVRETNPTRPVIVGPGMWNNVNELKSLRLPADKNLIVTVHYYLPHDFTHQATPWSDARLRGIVDLRWPRNAGEEAALKKDFAQVAAWAKEDSRPIYVGEFGAFEKAPLESRATWTRAVVDECEAHGFSYAYWEFGAGFGAYDPKNRAWKKPLLDALIRDDKR